MKALTAYENIVQHTESVEATELQEVRFVDKMEVGEFARQGDIYIVRISGVDNSRPLAKTRQLAAGNSQGSRHILEGAAEVFAPLSSQPIRTQFGEHFEGPSFKCDAHVTVTHPEHAHISLPPGCYQILHQMDLQTKQRVID